jgi:uncharacterized protein (TIGR03435 family)
MGLAAAAVLAMSASITAGARQAPGSEPAFDVVSIKRNTAEREPRRPTSPDRFQAEMTLRDLIRLAWELPGFRIVGGPPWASADRFVVNAMAAGVQTSGTLRPMLQRMLRERFALRTHMESRELAGYALVRARQDGRLGPSLKQAAIDCEPFLTGRRPMQDSGADQNGQPRCAVRVNRTAGGAVTQFLTGASLSRLTTSLENLLGRSVIDKTGLTGPFDFEFTFTTEGLAVTNQGRPPATSPDDAPAIGTALTEQLGLRLEPERTRVEVLVIDSVEQPAPD